MSKRPGVPSSVIVIGAGVGGLSAAADLARAGLKVTVIEKEAAPGGKMRQVPASGALIDSGPTVFTMRWVFEGLFRDAGRRLDDALGLTPASILARHAWRQGGRLDLHADTERSAAAIAAFAGTREADGYRAFCRQSEEIYETLRDSFMAAQRPNPVSLGLRVGLSRLPAMIRTRPFTPLWRELGRYFSDQRLRQLFARYSTYVGSSPWAAPATLMLVAHVEQDGVWLIDGGMHALARALQALGETQGADYHFATAVREILTRNGRACGVRLATGETLEADAVVFNGDASALGAGLLGPGVHTATPPTPAQKRSLSAITWSMRARTSGFPLSYHNVFFAEDYEREFSAIFRERRICEAPTVYICAQDRAGGPDPSGTPERLLVLINAPADGDSAPMPADEIARHRDAMRSVLSACGLELDFAEEDCVTTTPEGFGALFPGTGGAIYGRANHGLFGSFERPSARSRVPGLYLAGGSVHPGPGVPMAALSGRLAAERLLTDYTD